MRSKVIIISPSVIVRKGLFGVLKSYFNIDIQLLSSFTEIKELELVSHHLLLFSYPPDKSESRFLTHLKKENKLTHIFLFENKKHSYSGISYDYAIDLTTSAKVIYDLVTKLIEKKKEKSLKNISTELTEREKDILVQVAMGHSNKEIADKLFISIHTVISHRKNITKKLGIKSISGLTVYAILNNLLDPETIDPEKLI